MLFAFFVIAFVWWPQDSFGVDSNPQVLSLVCELKCVPMDGVRAVDDTPLVRDADDFTLLRIETHLPFVFPLL